MKGWGVANARRGSRSALQAQEGRVEGRRKRSAIGKTGMEGAVARFDRGWRVAARRQRQRAQHMAEADAAVRVEAARKRPLTMRKFSGRSFTMPFCN